MILFKSRRGGIQNIGIPPREREPLAGEPDGRGHDLRAGQFAVLFLDRIQSQHGARHARGKIAIQAGVGFTRALASRYISLSAAAGAVSRKLMKVSWPLAKCTVIKPPPPIFPQQGSTTASAYPTATAASMALPPILSISIPAWADRCCELTTMPFCASTAGNETACVDDAGINKPMLITNGIKARLHFIEVARSSWVNGGGE